MSAFTPRWQAKAQKHDNMDGSIWVHAGNPLPEWLIPALQLSVRFPAAGGLMGGDIQSSARIPIASSFFACHGGRRAGRSFQTLLLRSGL